MHIIDMAYCNRCHLWRGVCVCVVCEHVDVLCKNLICINSWGKITERNITITIEMAELIEMPFGGWELNCVGPRNHVLDGGQEGQFWGLPDPLKSIESLSCSVHSERDHSFTDNVMTCDMAFHHILWPLV